MFHDIIIDYVYCDCHNFFMVYWQDISDGDDFVPLKPVSEGAECKMEGGRPSTRSASQEQGDGEGEEEEERYRDMFEARLVIHQALHLPMMTDKTQ